MRPVRRQSSQAFEDRRDGLLEALSLSAAPGFHHDDLGMVPAFNMLGRGNRLHGKGFGMMQNLDKAIDRRRLLTENGLSSVDLESRFYAVLKGCAGGLALNPRRSKSREPKRPKAAKVFERKHRNGVLTPSRYQI